MRWRDLCLDPTAVDPLARIRGQQETIPSTYHNPKDR